MGKSTFIDPRFKNKGFSSDDSLKRVKEKLQDKIVALIKKTRRENSTGG